MLNLNTAAAIFSAVWFAWHLAAGEAGWAAAHAFWCVVNLIIVWGRTV